MIFSEVASVGREPTSEEKKKFQWEHTLGLLKQTVDGLGMEIDNGILETVAAFNVLGFETDASCEGHLDRGVASPWIDIRISAEDEESEKILEKKRTESDLLWDEQQLDPEAFSTEQEERMHQLWDEVHELDRQLAKPDLLEQNRLMMLLDQFYADRQVPYDARLSIQSMGRGARIQCAGADVQEVRDEQLKKDKLEEYQKEMIAFADFLKTQFFTNS